MYEIRKLGINDEAKLFEVLNENQMDNVFLLSNLKNFGLHHPDLHYWGSFRSGRLTGVLMRYRFSYGFYDHNNGDVEEFANLLNERRDGRFLIGKKQYIDRMIPYIKQLEILKDTSHVLATLEELTDRGLPHIPRKAESHEVSKIEALRKLGNIEKTVDHLHKRTKVGRHFVMEVGEELVSSASSEAETPLYAIIGKLYTHEPYRNRGYGSSCLQHLCNEVIQEGKLPCLFYETKEEGSLYKKLGFKEASEWRMVEFK